MDCGTRNEINATATFVGKVLPVIDQSVVYYEGGCVGIQLNNGHYVVISPDGSMSLGATT